MATGDGEHTELLSQALAEDRSLCNADRFSGKARRTRLFVAGGLALLGSVGVLVAFLSSSTEFHSSLASTTGFQVGRVSIKSEVAEVTGTESGEDTSEQPPLATRRGSFLVIGDWGYDAHTHGQSLTNKSCVRAIAEKMLETMQALGDVKFVINVGDSFYPSGVGSKWDPQWQKKWRDVFAPTLRSVPWYSVYGNHDYHMDPCACTDDLSQCAQIHTEAGNLDFFQMPNYTYHQPVPDFDMEIIGLDLNHFMPGWNHTKVGEDLFFPDCEWTPCKDECYGRMQRRMGASMDLFFDRAHKSDAKNLLVFSHYPTDYFIGGAPYLLSALRNNSKHDIMFFGGHRHSTDTWSTESIAPNTNWLVGGGGGWSCDSDDQGFVVGEIQEDYTVKTYAVLVDKEVCCVYVDR